MVGLEEKLKALKRISLSELCSGRSIPWGMRIDEINRNRGRDYMRDWNSLENKATINNTIKEAV